MNSISYKNRTSQHMLGYTTYVSDNSRTTTKSVNSFATKEDNNSVNVHLGVNSLTKRDIPFRFQSSNPQETDKKKIDALDKISEIKKRIEELKRLLTFFGPLVPSALLKELKQLASDLKNATKDLKDGCSNNTAGVTGLDKIKPLPINFEEPEEDNTYCILSCRHLETNGVEAVLSKITTQMVDFMSKYGDKPAFNNSNESDLYVNAPPEIDLFLKNSQHEDFLQIRQNEQRLVQDTLNELRLLLNRVKSKLQIKDKNQINEIMQLFSDTNILDNQLTMNIDSIVPMLNIEV